MDTNCCEDTYAVVTIGFSPDNHTREDVERILIEHGIQIYGWGVSITVLKDEDDRLCGSQEHLTAEKVAELIQNAG